MDKIDHKAGITFEFSEGVLTASSPDWTAQLEAWPEPRISFLRYERAEDDEEERREALLNLGDHVLVSGEGTSFWSRGKEELTYCQGGSNQRHIQLFWLTIPEEIREAIHSQTMYRWLLLSIFSHCPHAMDLSFSNPMLFHLLISRYAGKYTDESMPFEEIDAWARRKQADIMAHLNLPNSESNRRILLKVIPEARNAFFFDILANLEKNPRVHRIVEHLPQINTGITRILSWHPPYGNLTGPLLTEIAQLEDYDSIGLYYRLFNDTVNLLARAGMGDKEVHSIRGLKKLHDEICRRAPESLMYKHERNFTFPSPPYPGTPDIEPITTPEELFREGMETRHCVAIYAERVANSECYCYRVTAPVRATLEIRRDNNGEWQFSHMRKKCNWLIEDKIIHETWSALRESASDNASDLTIRSSGEFEQQLPLLTEEELAIFKQVTAAFAG